MPLKLTGTIVSVSQERVESKLEIAKLWLFDNSISES